MAEPLIVTCPECKKRFKPKTDVRGKKVKCPSCKSIVAVPADDKKSEAVKSGKPEPEAAPAAAAAAPEPAPEKVYDDFEADPNPYGVKDVPLVPRCPNCTEEMGKHDIICLKCGYNTLTREWGKTEKTIAVTYGKQLKYLLPAIGAAVFSIGSIIFLVYYSVASPYHVADVPVLNLTDHESLRMWTTVIFLGWLWGAGLFCFKKFIEKPKPDEEQSE
mgnify:CR=1 FL=1